MSWEESVAMKLGKARKSGSKINVDTFVDKALAKKRDKEWKAMSQEEKDAFEDSYNAFGTPLSYYHDDARAKQLKKILKKAETEYIE